MSKVAILVALSLGLQITGASAASWAEGRYLAEQYCARCHNIEPRAPSKLSPPSFEAIATYRTEKDIFDDITSPSVHGLMPEVVWFLSPAQIQDLLAYIGSLDKASH